MSQKAQASPLPTLADPASQPEDALFSALGSGINGLSEQEAQERLARFGQNVIHPKRQDSALRSFLRQLSEPLVLILLFAAAVSLFTGEYIDATIVLLIVLASTLLSFFQEYTASHAVEKLRSQVTAKATVVRGGVETQVDASQVVPGDILVLSAGSLIAADCRVVLARDFFVNQAVLTGETFPVEKSAEAVPAGSSLANQHNMAFLGTSVRQGTARALVISTGAATAFGQIASRLNQKPEETEFEKGIRSFGYLLTKIVLVLVLAVLCVNVLLKKPVIDSLLFAIALAVGIAPELLPAILNINLSKGAQAMAKEGVIVRRLNAIENLGSMDILCTDKTGTITKGVVELDGALDPAGSPSEKVMLFASLNAALQTGLTNPLDEAILSRPHPYTQGMNKLEEIPYDFSRKRLSVVVDMDPGSAVLPLLITKGALDPVLSICSFLRREEEDLPLSDEHRQDILDRYAAWSQQGYRVLGVAVKNVAMKERYTVEEDEVALSFAGFLLFFDPPKEDVKDTIKNLAAIGVDIKIITGDNRLVASHVAKTIGLSDAAVLAAGDMQQLSDEALWKVAQDTQIFAEVDPNQKERIIQALRRSGHVVGYMGDGINDAPALKGADIGISVDTAVDVAKDAADFVLLQQDLSVLIAGVKEGRRTFANTLKYIYTTTSANFGNMLSMAGASLFLPFLPMLAKQILLNNFLSDIPAIGVPSDRVDPEMVDRPHKWDIKRIRVFMLSFGALSSVFDYLTFGLLLLIFKAGEAQFQTGWFLESLLTELVIALVVRTRRVFFKSRPGKLLFALTLLVAVIGFVLPYSPIAADLGLVQLPLWLMFSLVGVTALYVTSVEVLKRWFYKRFPM